MVKGVSFLDVALTHLFDNRKIRLKPAPAYPLIIVLTFLELAQIEVLKSKSIIRAHLLLHISSEPSELKLLLKANHCLPIVLHSLVALAHLVKSDGLSMVVLVLSCCIAQLLKVLKRLRIW